MVKQAFHIALIACALSGAAQDTTPFIGKGLLRGSGAISPGFMMDASGTNIYLNGKLEYFAEDRLSFRGEGFWYQGSQQDDPLLARNNQITFGPFYHFVHGRLDASVGFEPGISIVQPGRPVLQETVDPLRVVPSASLCVGLTYTVWDYFHFFLDARYVHASYPGSATGTIPLDEVIVSGGLGWQFRVKR